MSGRETQHRSLAASVTRSRQVHTDHAADRADADTAVGASADVRGDVRADGDVITVTRPRPQLRPFRAGGLLERSVSSAPPPVPPLRDDADTAAQTAPNRPSSGAGSDGETDASQRRRSIGQVVGVVALIAGAWAFLAATNSSVMPSDLGSDAGGMTPERVAIVEVLEGVVGLVEGGSDGAVGDQGADFGAGDGSPGRPPAAPSMVGRDQPSPAEPGPTGSTPGSSAPGSPTTGVDPGAAGVAAPSTASSTPSSTPSTGGSPTTETRGSSSSTTLGSSTTTRGSSSTTHGPSTTEEPPVTVAEATTTSPPESTCVVVVSRRVKLWDAPGGGSEIGLAQPDTYRVLERSGARWYHIAGGWVRDTGQVSPQSC